MQIDLGGMKITEVTSPRLFCGWVDCDRNFCLRVPGVFLNSYHFVACRYTWNIVRHTLFTYHVTIFSGTTRPKRFRLPTPPVGSDDELE